MALLVAHGASAIGFTYEDRMPSGLTFQIETANGTRGFSLPIRQDAVFEMLKRAKASGQIRSHAISVTPEHALNVAWRILLDWLKVNIAMIEIGLAELRQVLLGWQLVAPGTSMYEAVLENEQAAISAASQ